jgi:hypothetical protein
MKLTSFRRSSLRLAAASLPLAAFACNESSTKPTQDGGAEAHGLVVVMSDYTSSNVALSELDGTTKVPSFLSSGTMWSSPRTRRRPAASC